jgi:hypothetical protein
MAFAEDIVRNGPEDTKADAFLDGFFSRRIDIEVDHYRVWNPQLHDIVNVNYGVLPVPCSEKLQSELLLGRLKQGILEFPLIAL